MLCCITVHIAMIHTLLYIYTYIEESAQNRTPILFLILKIYKIVKNYVFKSMQYLLCNVMHHLHFTFRKYN
jgi:hypothetical protein